MSGDLTDLLQIELHVTPPLAVGQALVILVRDRQCFHRIIGLDDAKVLDPLFADVINPLAAQDTMR